MKGPPTYGSVCSGIEAATQAWHPLGWKPLWFSEIEPFPSAVLAHRHPTVPNLGDMTTLPARILSGEIEAPDVLVGGTPCQSFSVAGLRGGLSDPRGQLTRSFVEIADAIDTVRDAHGLPPAIAVWENVPGVLSDNDNAFGNFLAALVGEEVALVPPGERWSDAGAVLGPARRAAWRVLDAQYFGLAQRRRRVFLVVGARTGRVDPVEVLLVEPGVRRDSPPLRESWQGTPSPAGGGTAAGGGGRGTDGRDGGRDGGVVVCARESGQGYWMEDDVAGTLRAEGENRPSRPSHVIASAQNQLGEVPQPNMTVRRLTPVECERLQGFPDDHTRIPYRGMPADECPDSSRYKALGNSMAVPVMNWIGTRIDEVRRGVGPTLDDVPDPGDVFDLFGG